MGERGGAFSVEGVPMRELRKSKPSLPGCIVPTLRKSRRVGQPVVYSLPRKAGPAPRERPILLRVEPKAGHGVGKPITKQIEELTDVYSFLFWQLGMKE